MRMEVASDVASLDVELLQLPEVSTIGLKSNFTFVETLYQQWLSLPESNRLVCFVIDIVRHSFQFDEILIVCLFIEI